MSGASPGWIFFRALATLNQSARSTSGKDCTRPLLGGHSISNRLELSVSVSKSPSNAPCRDHLPAELRKLAELKKGARARGLRSAAELFLEFADGADERLLVGFIFALRD